MQVELEISAVAHGGHGVARIPADSPLAGEAGRVVFVRHALPGETVLAEVTSQGKVWRADAIEVLAGASRFRVPSAWPAAGPGGVGGGELAHVSPQGQQRWRAAVLTDQLRRLARIDVADIRPEFAISARDLQSLSPFSGASPGISILPGGALGYRTRMTFHTDDDGALGMRKHQSHQVVPLASMPLATPALQQYAEQTGVWGRRWAAHTRVTLVLPAGQPPSAGLTLINGETAGPRGGQGGDVVIETVQVGDATHVYEVPADGFWQVHAAAPTWLATEVLAAAQVEPGERVLDLYAGAGLLTVPLAAAVGPNGRVVGIEGAKRAAASGAKNLAAYPQARMVAGDVARSLHRLQLEPWNTVVLDPPRTGAGRAVVEQVASFKPTRIVYVACDPAALARDINYFQQLGYELTNLSAADLFPMTHHFESIATLTRF